MQAQDLERTRLQEELADAPRRVAAAATALRKAQASLAATEAELKKEEALRRSQESDVNDRRGKIGRLQKQLESAANAQQVTAYEHEIDFAEKAISAFEDEELASLERTDQQEATQKAAKSLVEKLTAALASETERATSVKARNTEILVTIEAERKRLRSAISEKLLAAYDRVSKARGTGIAEGVDHKCSACQMMVRPQRWNDLTDRANHDAIFTCESCGRFLYWDPRRDAPVAFRPGEQAATAQ